jgi:hypothetical protein
MSIFTSQPKFEYQEARVGQNYTRVRNHIYTQILAGSFVKMRKFVRELKSQNCALNASPAHAFHVNTNRPQIWIHLIYNPCKVNGIQNTQLALKMKKNATPTAGFLIDNQNSTNTYLEIWAKILHSHRVDAKVPQQKGRRCKSTKKYGSAS